MKKNYILKLLLIVAFNLSLHSCRTEDEITRNTKELANKFQVFIPPTETAKVDYPQGFAFLFKEYDRIHNTNFTGLKISEKEVFSQKGNISEEHIDFSISSQAMKLDNGEIWVYFPVVENGQVTKIVIGMLQNDETYVKLGNLDQGEEYNQMVLQKFKQAYLKKTLSTSTNKGKEPTCGFEGLPPCDIDVIDIPPPRGPYHNTPYLGTNPSEGGGGGGGCAPYNNCGGGGGGITPPPQNPCNRLKIQTTNPEFKSNVTTLEGKTGDDHENGFRMGTNSDGTIQNQILQNKPGTQQVDMSIFPNTITLMHSHYDGLYPIFSPGDILLFNQWIIWAQNWNSIATNTPKIPLNNLTFTLVTSWGNYSFTFDGTNSSAFPNYTQQEFDNLNNQYQEMLNGAVSVANVSGSVNYNMQELEKQFLKFMDKNMSMSGAKLFRTGEGGNTALSLVNGNLNENNCP
ncbi:hypothetical protein C1637_25035 [Chryseobacterium lactis]|uniref:Uncharacterized protein n=1 Tax=Chryseobacterium lactis TaxID=1241981 RepID=A0AA91YAY8_CHRLC|nr:hypothetical protein [Chryseobacterium lactis]PNW10939.1 hypothetical protein C1637_25035 [Chryseobacterium lactis]